MRFLQKEDIYLLNNHLSFKILYHQDHEMGTSRVIGFEVTPYRYSEIFASSKLCCSHGLLNLDDLKFKPIFALLFSHTLIHVVCVISMRNLGIRTNLDSQHAIRMLKYM